MQMSMGDDLSQKSLPKIHTFYVNEQGVMTFEGRASDLICWCCLELTNHKPSGVGQHQLKKDWRLS